MKRSKKMFLAAMVAVVAVTVMMIAPAFAASANCPLKGLLTSTASGSPLQQLSGSNNATPSNGTDLSGLLQQYLGNSGSTCPKTALLQQLLGGNVAGANANTAACPNGDCTTGTCTNGTCAANNCTSGNCATVCPSGTCSNGSCSTGSCPLSGLLGQ